MNLQETYQLSTPIFENIKYYLIDMDGSFYIGNTPNEGSIAFIEKLAQTGRDFLFLTNNSSGNAESFSRKLLLTSVPEMRQGWLEEVMETRVAISGIAQSVELLKIDCPFYSRCPMAIEDICNTQMPPVRQPLKNHDILCHRKIDELMEAEQFDLIEETSTY